MNYTYKEYYKLSGSSFQIAELFNAEREAALKRWHKFVEELGAVSARPDHTGCMRSLLFAGKDVPVNWRQIGQHDGGIECVPHRGSKAGKKITVELKKLPRVRGYLSAVGRISKDISKANQVKSGNRIMWATAQRLSFPEVIYLVSVPRALDDGLKIPKDWIELSEREYTLAFHDHNNEIGNAA